jgi:hypothetical protein
MAVSGKVVRLRDGGPYCDLPRVLRAQDLDGIHISFARGLLTPSPPVTVTDGNGWRLIGDIAILAFQAYAGLASLMTAWWLWFGL